MKLPACCVSGAMAAVALIVTIAKCQLRLHDPQQTESLRPLVNLDGFYSLHCIDFV